MTFTALEIALVLMVVGLVVTNVLSVFRRNGNGNGEAAAWRQIARDLMADRNRATQLARARGEQLDEVGIPAITQTELKLMADLAEDIADRFDADEMDMLAMQSGIDSDEIKGTTKSAKALALVRRADRLGLLKVLISEIAKERPA